MEAKTSANIHDAGWMNRLRQSLAPNAFPVEDPFPLEDAGLPEAEGTSVLDLFVEVVARFPNAVAVSDDSTSLTYVELWNFAAAFRDRLADRGFAPGEMVGIAAERCVATVAAILGIVMAGGCYVPVHFDDFPASILQQLVQRNRLRYWIADTHGRQAADSFLSADNTVIPLEGAFQPSKEVLASVPRIAIDARAPLYVMFTSGSTGLPKGVVVPHRGVVRLVTAQDFLRFAPEETFLLHSPLSFDASTLELWGGLLHGSHLVVAPPARLGLDDYSRIIRERGITTLWMTAALFHLAVEHMPEMFAPLSQLVFGGDVVAPRYVEEMRKLYPNLHMVNGYGPTENTTFTCCYVVPSDYRATGSLPIGSSIVHTTVHILNSDGLEVPRGEDGELVAGGAGVALGYLGQPETTESRFIPDPFSSHPGAKMYRTGDRVREREDGSIEFLGRMDRQVKIGGHRVELDAVEQVLSGSSLVREAAVVVQTPATGEKRIVACVVLSTAVQNSEAELREWVRERLLSAAIPQRWVFLPSLPLTPNGKLDRKALLDRCQGLLPRNRGENSRDAVPSDVTTEKPSTLAGIAEFLGQLWGRLLGRDSVGPDENFFDLGGSSLLLIEMHSRLRAQFSGVPSLVEMFTFPTPRLLADRIFRGHEIRNDATPSETRGQRQRAAILARRGVSASNIPAASERKDGTR